MTSNLRPLHVPTDHLRGQVAALSGYGIPHVAIAAYIGISRPTLEKYYRADLDAGTTRANVAVAKTLFDLATGDKNVAACIFWLKTRAGWQEKIRVEASGPDGGPMQVATLDVTKLSDDDLRHARRIAITAATGTDPAV